MCKFEVILLEKGCAVLVWYKIIWSRIISSCHWNCSVKNMSLKILQNSQGNKPQGLQLYQKETPAQVLSCEFCDIFKNTLFPKHFRAVLSGCCTIGAFYPELKQVQISHSQLLVAPVSLKHCILTARYLISKVIFGPTTFLKRDSNTGVFC